MRKRLNFVVLLMMSAAILYAPQYIIRYNLHAARQLSTLNIKKLSVDSKLVHSKIYSDFATNNKGLKLPNKNVFGKVCEVKCKTDKFGVLYEIDKGYIRIIDIKLLEDNLKWQSVIISDSAISKLKLEKLYEFGEIK